MTSDAVLYGFVLALCNAVISFGAVWLGMKQEREQHFLRIVFGSMGVRLLLTLIAVWWCLHALRLAPAPFVLTLLSCYLMLMIAEIALLVRKYPLLKHRQNLNK
jgi:FtsH-binding integral membrane protein